MRSNRPSSVLFFVVLLAGGAVLGATVPKDKRVILLDLIAGKKGAVEFFHEKHAKEFKKVGGVGLSCQDCHHALASASPADGEKVKGCSECHARVGEGAKMIEGKEAPNLAVESKPGKVKQKSILFHQSCLGCHKEMKAEGKKITACKTCHKK